MKKKYNPDEYIYACARVRAIEGGIVGSERCARLAETKNASEFFRALEEYGIRAAVRQSGDGSQTPEAAALSGLEEALTAIITEAFTLTGKIAPQPKMFDFFRYPYDCHNIKSTLKSILRGTEPDSLLYTFGTVAPSTAVTLAAQREVNSVREHLPCNMAAALPEAAELYSKTGDPQLIDITLDAACYADMTALAAGFGCEYLMRLAAIKVDVTNFLTAVRMLRMKGAHINFEYFKRMALPFAELGTDFFEPAFNPESGSPEAREELLTARLRRTQYSALAEMLLSAPGRPTLTFAEKQCDDFYLNAVKEAKGVLYGPEPVGAYIVAREYEVRNLRIIAAGKLSGLPVETIKERLRSSYA